MKKALLITYFLILIPYISAQGQETDSLEIEKFKTVSFKVGTINHIAINFEKKIHVKKNAAVISSFGPAYMYPTFDWDGGAFEPIHGPSLLISWSRLGGKKPYHLRDTHFEIRGGLYLLMSFYDFNESEFDGIKIYPKTSIGYRYQSPSSDTIFRFYVGFGTIGFSIGSK